MEKEKIKKEIKEILDNYIANDLPVDKDEMYNDLLILIFEIITDGKEKK